MLRHSFALAIVAANGVAGANDQGRTICASTVHPLAKATNVEAPVIESTGQLG